MPDQNECSAHDAYRSTSQTRPTSGILSPASESALNLDQPSTRTSKKRKRDANTMEDLLDDAFVVKVCSNTIDVILLPETDKHDSHIRLLYSSSLEP